MALKAKYWLSGVLILVIIGAVLIISRYIQQLPSTTYQLFTQEKTEGFKIPKFRRFLEKNGIDKPLWITELQYSAMALSRSRLSEEEWDKFIIKNFVQAFNTGADKIFI